MTHSNSFQLPQSTEVHSSYQYASGDLVVCGDKGGTPENLTEAKATHSIWESAQRLTDAAMIVVKSGQRVSIAALNGGLIVQGSSKLNIGLFRAATRHLEPVPSTIAATTQMKSDDRFRRAYWSVLQRLNGAVLPRTFLFDLAGLRGTITVRDGQLSFAGDFTNPKEFVGELRAACQVSDDVMFTLEELKDEPAGPFFTLTELLQEVAPDTEADAYIFDAEGWPVACKGTADFGTLQTLSLIAKALSTCGDATKDLTVYSNTNRPLLSGSLMADGNMRFETR